VIAALGATEVDLRAARAAREAEGEVRERLAGELDAERAAHVVARGTAQQLAAGLRAARMALAEAHEELAGVRADLRNARDAADGARERLVAAQAGTGVDAGGPAEAGALLARIADFDRLGARADAEALQRRALEQAAAAAARGRTAAPGRLLADLDAAAAALRSAPAPPASEPAPEPAPAPPAAHPAREPAPAPAPATARPAPPRLRTAVVALAREDARAAGELLAALLPAQGPLLAAPVAYDLTLRGHGTFAVTVTGNAASVSRVPAPRPRGAAAFHLTTDPLALAELLAGEPVRIGRLIGRARLRGRRGALRPVLSALQWSGATLADAVRAGAVLDPLIAYRVLAHAVDPAWTRGHAFTVLHVVTGEPTVRCAIAVRDGRGLTVAPAADETATDATVTMSRGTFARLLREEPVPAGERPAVRGDQAAVALLREWTDHVRGH
jgi:hypothetical protein